MNERIILVVVGMVISMGNYVSPDSMVEQKSGDFGGSVRLVLAFHYPWYGYKDERWDKSDSIIDHPLIGPYNSTDPKLIDFQFSLARDAGIDAFVVSWGGPRHMTDIIFRQMLDQLRGSPFSFRLTICYENMANNPSILIETVQEELAYILREYGNHKAFLRVDGKPVIFIYDVAHWSPERWKAVLETVTREQGPAIYIGESLDPDYLSAFDGLHTYDNVYIADEKLLTNYSQIAEMAHRIGKRLVATVVGGDKRIQKLGFDIDRSNGRFIRNRLNIAEKAGADWIVITSWNEWFEARQIEPSREYKFEGIKHTREMTTNFKRIGIKTLEEAELSITYKRSDTEMTELTVINTGKQTVYYVTYRSGNAMEELISYVLHPGETVTVFVKIADLSFLKVSGYLPDNTTVQSSVPLKKG